LRHFKLQKEIFGSLFEYTVYKRIQGNIAIPRPITHSHGSGRTTMGNRKFDPCDAQTPSPKDVQVIRS